MLYSPEHSLSMYLVTSTDVQSDKITAQISKFSKM